MLDAEVYLHLDMPGRYVNGWMGKVGSISISFYVLSELQGMTMNLLVAANRKRICLQRRFHLILHYPALRRQCGRPVFLGPEEKGGLVYGQKKSSLIDNINARWTEDGIYVEMPEELFNELESLLVERYGIDIEEALRQYFRWAVEKPEEFREWVMECRKME